MRLQYGIMAARWEAGTTEGHLRLQRRSAFAGLAPLNPTVFWVLLF